MSNKKSAVSDGMKLFKHLVIISLLVVAGAVAAHFGLVLFTRHGAHCTVPEFKGLILNEAEMVAQQKDLKIVINDSLYAPMYEGGMVLDQLPKAGVGVKPGRTIYVTINAFGVKMVTVPYVAGRSLRQAKNMLEVAGLQIEKLVYEPDMATNYVLAQYCGKVEITEESKHDTKVGSGITLHVGVSERNSTTIVPQFIGLTLAEAKSRMWESGLNIGRIKNPIDTPSDDQAQAIVYSQSIPKGEELTLGRPISLNLTYDSQQVDEILENIATIEREQAKLRAQEEDSLAKVKIMELTRQKMERESQTVVVEQESVDSFFE